MRWLGRLNHGYARFATPRSCRDWAPRLLSDVTGLRPDQPIDPLLLEDVRRRSRYPPHRVAIFSALVWTAFARQEKYTIDGPAHGMHGILHAGNLVCEVPSHEQDRMASAHVGSRDRERHRDTKLCGCER